MAANGSLPLVICDRPGFDKNEDYVQFVKNLGKPERKILHAGDSREISKRLRRYLRVNEIGLRVWGKR